MTTILSAQQTHNEATTADSIAEYRFAGHRVDVRQRRLFNAADEPLNLSSRAFDTLLALLDQHGEVLSKAALMSVVWPNLVVEENNLNQAISSLRKALGDTKSESRFILTIPGRGYSFVAPVEALAAPSVSAPGTGDDNANTASAASDHVPDTPQGPATTGQLRARSRLMLPLPLVAALLLLLGLLQWLPRQTDGEADTSAAAGSEVIRNSVAVLPFVNLNPDGDNSLFALGLHDEVTSQLTKIRSLNVIARSSVLGLVEQGLAPDELGRILRVESMMSGTLLFDGTQVRVNLQLLNPATGLTLWAGNYEANTRDLAGMIAVQGEIAAQVAQALEAEVLQSERDDIALLPTDSFKAYRYNLAAKNAHHQQDYAQEWQLARMAIELDPTYYDALYTFASVNVVLVATPLPGMTNREHYQLGLQAAERMIELHPERGDGYALRAVALGTVPDWDGVEEMTDKLEALNVPLANRHYIALLLLCLGQFDEAIAIYQASLVTEPLNFFGRGFLMVALELAGRPDVADAEYRLGEELTPAWWGDQARIFLSMGRGATLEDVDELRIPPDLKQVLHAFDDKDALRTALDAYVARPDKVSAQTLYYAAFAAHLGDHALAVELMDATLQDVWTSLVWFWLPVFDEARQLDSFKELLRGSRVVDHWRKHGWPPVCRPLEGDDFSCDWSARP